MSLGDNIKKIRKEKKFTQQQLADALEISRSYLGDIENDRYNPSSRTVKMLAEKLNVSMLYLTTGEKALSDLTDDEFNNMIENEDKTTAFESINNTRTYIKTLLKELVDSELKTEEVIFILNAFNYLKNSSSHETLVIAALLRSLEQYRDIGKNDEINQKELLDEINDIAEDLKIFMMDLFSYKEGD